MLVSSDTRVNASTMRTPYPTPASASILACQLLTSVIFAVF